MVPFPVIRLFELTQGRGVISLFPGGKPEPYCSSIVLAFVKDTHAFSLPLLLTLCLCSGPSPLTFYLSSH